jgi:hypothetical protein
MNNGRPDEPLPEQPKQSEVPEDYLACARWLLQNPAVLEVWGLVSNLPEIGTAEAAVTLDAGTWFLCRVSLPPIAEGESIMSFVSHWSDVEE